MAAMAPALTDASAHPSSFKLPISPSDPERTGFEATPSDPTSPGLPNGHTNTSHTHINTDQAILETELDEDLLLQQGGENRSGGNNHRSKAQLFRTNSQRGTIPPDSRLTFLGKLDRGKVGRSLSFPPSTRAPGLTNGGDTVGDVTKMSHPSLPGAYDKQQPCQTSAHTATSVTMPPETSSLSLSNNTGVTGGSSTATADSSDVDDDTRGGHVDNQASDEKDSGPPQDLDISYEKLVSKINNIQNTEGWMRDGKNSNFLWPELLEAEQINEVADEHSRLAQRARQLAQKLRQLETQQISTHIQQQIQNFVREQHKSLEPKASEADTEGCPECKRNSTVSDPNVPSTSQRNYNANSGLFGEAAKDQLSRTCNHKRKPLLARPTDTDTSQRVAVKTASKHLQSKLEHVESWVDSDETESSSGGESCDEGDDTLPSYTQTRQKHKVPLHRRAMWKWAVERASIASRWTWLQAQVSDLEYRIRQQSDIYRQTRASKGVAILGDSPSQEELIKLRMASSKTNRKLSPIEAKIARLGGNQEMSPSNLSTLLTNVDQQSARLKRSLQNCASPTPGLPMTPSATSTPAGAVGKAPLSKPMNGIVGNAGSRGSPLFGMVSSPGVAHKQLPAGTNSFPASPSLIPTVPEEHYCARTRPVFYFRKRKLIRTMSIHSFSRKIQKLSTVRCGCCPPLTPCVMCGGRFNHVEKPKEPDMAPLNERVAQLDYSFHPVLSFPQDIPLSIQFEGMMKSNEWQRKPAPSKQSPAKKKRRPSTPTESKDGPRPKRKYERKNKDKGKRHQSSPEDKSLKMLRKLAAQTMKDMRHGRGDNKILKRASSKSNSLPNTPKKLLTEEINRRCRTDIKKRRAAQLAIAALKKTRARSLSLPNIKDHFHHHGSMSSAPSTPTVSDGSPATHLSHSMPSTSLQNFLKPRRPGGGSDQYDIDNIVIPYSMLASTRVEKLEYKEIMTPKWRKIPEEQLTAWRNHVRELNNHEEEPENLSDGEFMERHTKCEIRERQKFLTILANQTTHGHQRRGARRSRNNSQGNTPEPYSPDANLFEQNQPSSVNSSNAPSPLTTQEALSPTGGVSLSSGGGGKGTIHRSRTSSWEKRRSSSASDTNLENSLQGSFEEIGHIDNPWPMRSFPLDDSEVGELGWEPEEEPEEEPEQEPEQEPEEELEVKKEPDTEEKTPSEISSSTTSLPNNLKIEGGSSRSSPLGELLEDSSSPEDVEDPNDPEWTVVSPDRQRSSIVLRLAKR